MPSGDAHLRRWRIVEHVLIAAFAIYLLYFLTGFRFESLVTGDTRQADFRMWYLLPPQIAAQDYPSVVTGNWDISFPYLPSAVAMMLPLSLMPQVAAFIVWMILQGLAFVTVIWASLRLAGLERSHLRLPIAAAAVFVVGSAIEWDLRAHNNNLIYLALVMLGLTARRTWVAAALFAVTANLKLYSGILIPGLLWRREVRLAVATGLIGRGAGGRAPPACLRPGAGAQAVRCSWINEILYTVSDAGRAHAPLSLHKTAAALLGVAPTASASTLAARGVQLLWLALVAFYFLVPARRPGTGGVARLCDVIVLLMLPLPISSWLVPYHGVGDAAGLHPDRFGADRLATARRACGSSRASPARAASRCASRLPAWELRAGTLTLSLMLTLAALAAIRSSPERTAVSSSPV